MNENKSKIDQLLEENFEPLNPEDLDKELESDENIKNWEPKWFLIQTSSFGNYDKKAKILVSEVGKNWVKKIVDEKGNPKLDENGNQITEKIDKDWTEIAIPFSKNSEFIRVKNTRIVATKSKNYFKIVLNGKSKTMPVYSLLNKKIEDQDMKKILDKFESNQKSIISKIEQYHKEQELESFKDKKEQNQK